MCVRLRVRLRLGPINTTWEICRSKSTNQFGERNERLPDLCFSICRFSQVVFIPQAQPHAQSLFRFPIVFGLIWFIFSIFSTRKKNGAGGNSIVRFAASIPCQSRRLTVRRIRTVSKSATFLAMESVNAAHFKRWETEVQNFGKEKRKTLRQYWGAHFWQGEVQNSSPILARQWWRHFRLSLSLSVSLSLSLSLSHRMSPTTLSSNRTVGEGDFIE